MLYKKFILTLILVSALVISCMFKISIAKDKNVDVPTEVTIENKYKNPKKYVGSKFTHKKHAEEYKTDKGEKIACDSCHHVYKDGKNTWKEGDKVAKCITCHSEIQNLSPSKAKKLSQEEKVKEISWAYHENCYMCHKAVKKAAKIAKEQSKAWTSCAKCHPRKKK